jgi:hypothetical protein
VTTVAAGTALCASMMAAATAVPWRKPSRDAISLVETPDLPSRAARSLPASLSGSDRQRGMERGQEVRARKSRALGSTDLCSRPRTRCGRACRHSSAATQSAGFDEAEGRIIDGGVFFDDLEDFGAQPIPTTFRPL